MRVIVNRGETVEIVFSHNQTGEVDTDGVISVTFDDTEISVNADMADSDGREGKIYSERFGGSHVSS